MVVKCIYNAMISDMFTTVNHMKQKICITMVNDTDLYKLITGMELESELNNT